MGCFFFLPEEIEGVVGVEGVDGADSGKVREGEGEGEGSGETAQDGRAVPRWRC